MRKAAVSVSLRAAVQGTEMQMVLEMLLQCMAAALEWGQGVVGSRRSPHAPPQPWCFPSLRENSISKEGGPAIAHALRTNCTLKKLE